MSEKVIARDREHLKQLIKQTIEKEGPNCDLNFIDVSQVKDMSNLFRGTDFNGDISQWDVSHVKGLMGMFISAPFNGDISNWNVSSETNMENMFYNCPLCKNPPKWYKDKGY